MVHLFVLHKLSMRKRLLAHLTKSNIPPTVDLMCGKVGFWNVMLAITAKLGIFLGHSLIITEAC